jgi:hypothetical protein
MKALDTPVLLEILHDGRLAKDLLKGLRGEELATTEANVFELEALSSEGPKGQRSARQSTISRLRRRMTVLPITADSVREAAGLLRVAPAGWPYAPLVWGTLVAAGCGEWITTRAFAPSRGLLPFKVRLI